MKPHEPPGCHELLHRPLGERPLTPARPRLPASFRPRNRCPRSVLRFHWTSNRSARVSWRSSPGKQSACHSTTPRQGALGLGTQGMCEQSDWANGRAGVRVEMKWNEGGACRSCTCARRSLHACSLPRKTALSISARADTLHTQAGTGASGIRNGVLLRRVGGV